MQIQFNVVLYRFAGEERKKWHIFIIYIVHNSAQWASSCFNQQNSSLIFNTFFSTFKIFSNVCFSLWTCVCVHWTLYTLYIHIINILKHLCVFSIFIWYNNGNTHLLSVSSFFLIHKMKSLWHNFFGICACVHLCTFPTTKTTTKLSSTNCLFFYLVHISNIKNRTCATLNKWIYIQFIGGFRLKALEKLTRTNSTTFCSSWRKKKYLYIVTSIFLSLVFLFLNFCVCVCVI